MKSWAGTSTAPLLIDTAPLVVGNVAPLVTGASDTGWFEFSLMLVQDDEEVWRSSKG